MEVGLEQFRNVAPFRANVQNGGTHGDHIVYLARVNQAKKRVAHNHRMEIRG
jgi:hypothetical protein